MEGCERNNRRCSKQVQIAEEARSIEAKAAEERKHEMEVEIEKSVGSSEGQLSRGTHCPTTEKAWHKFAAEEDARRIPGAEGHQQRTLKRSPSLSKSILNREATGSIASQQRHESCEAEWCIQAHAAQGEVAAVEEQEKLVKKSRDQARTKQRP